MPKPPPGFLANAVRETLDSVVTPSVRNAILDRALRAARRPQLPTDPRELDAFVQGPLADVLVTSLGPELGASVTVEIGRILSAASKATPPRGEASRPPRPRKEADTVRPPRRSSQRDLTKATPKKASRSTMPSRDLPAVDSLPAHDESWPSRQARGVAPTVPATQRVVPPEISLPPAGADHGVSARPGHPSFPSSADYPRGTAKALGVIGTLSVDPSPGGRPTVLVASDDPALVRSFRAWLDMRATVEVVTGTRALLEKLSAEPGEARTVVVLDGKRPSIRPLSLAALADELPASTTVLLWGVTANLFARMCTVSAAAETWLFQGDDTTTEEIVARCAKLLG